MYLSPIIDILSLLGIFFILKYEGSRKEIFDYRERVIQYRHRNKKDEDYYILSDNKFNSLAIKEIRNVREEDRLSYEQNLGYTLEGSICLFKKHYREKKKLCNYFKMAVILSAIALFCQCCSCCILLLIVYIIYIIWKTLNN